uniref:Uncharacterized protein n=1 Tax=Strombidium inclinatum TaxID=197538 RepID=A0A7S3ITH9_9SPIT|mmetsp:Transcript_39556/g.60435  ORF Transcript_39556/g.60435 Transcript_39556/m.60435 type:complete len:184 (+) Transcript_39556:1278-1829(+)
MLQQALLNIDEEKLYTKHIFDRFDLEALLTTLIRKGSYIAIIIAVTYIFKMVQKNFYNRQKRRAVHEKEGFELFYRIWYCVILSQITYAGIMVEIIWSYNQYNFFFWLQVYSAYSVYTCLNAILHNKYEKYLPIVFLVASIFLSRLIYFLFKKVSGGLSLFDSISELSISHLDGSQPQEWIGP